MKCKRCGSTVDGHFCQVCGAPVENPKEQKQKGKKPHGCLTVLATFFVSVFALGGIGAIMRAANVPEAFPSSQAYQTEMKKENEEKEKEKEEQKDPFSSLDFDTVVEQTLESITNPEFFPYVKDVSITKDENTIYFSAALDDSTVPSKALDYADTMIRQFNLFANINDQSIAPAGTDYYGGLYDYYNIMVGVSPLSKIKDPEHWFVHDYVGARLHTKQPIQLEDAFLNEENEDEPE